MRHLKKFLWLSICFLALLGSFPFTNAIDKSKFCNGWDNLTFEECDELYDFFNSELTVQQNITEIIYKNDSVTINRLEIIEDNVDIDYDQLRPIIIEELEGLKGTYNSRFENYSDKKNQEIRNILENQLAFYRSGQNITFDLDVSNLENENFVSRQEFLNYMSTIDSDNNSGIDLSIEAIAIGVIIIGGGVYFYRKQQQDQKRKDQEYQLRRDERNFNRDIGEPYKPEVPMPKRSMIKQ